MKILILTTLKTFTEIERLEEEAKNLGHECKVVDFSDMSYSIINSKVDIKEFDDFVPDKVVIKGITRNKVRTASIINQFRENGIPVFDNNYANHQYSIDKVADLMKLANKGIPVPDTYYVHDYNQYYAIAERIGYPLIVKSVGGGKGIGVYKADSVEELDKIIRDQEAIEKKPGRFILEEFIPYVHDLRVLIIGDKEFVMKRIPNEGDFRANFSQGGSVELFKLDKEGIALARKALSAINMTIGGVDVLITEDDNRYILEVNHTPGFTGMEEATGKNIGRIYLEHALEAAHT